MPGSGFPTDEYTPHGYLANPLAVAHSWSDGEGGCLRTTRDYVGMGWQLPWALRARASIDLVVTLESDGRRLETRTEFEAAGLVSTHHSANLFVYRWEAFGRRWEAAYTRVEDSALGLRIAWTASDSTTIPDTMVSIGLRSWRRATGRDGEVRAPSITSRSERMRSDGTGWPRLWVDLGAPFGHVNLNFGGVAAEPPESTVKPAFDEAWIAATPPPLDDPPSTTHPIAIGFHVSGSPSGVLSALAVRVPTAATGPSSPDSVPLPHRQHPTSEMMHSEEGSAVEKRVTNAISVARNGDDAFWNGATRLEGDWPASWRRGWVYDTETTRMCVYPPGGIFTDVWPAWMVQWPRAVVAEGALDMARFGYANPELAQRALLSLFRDATAPNVPCVFQHGEPNMVASDGSICGTSPAWCIPFYNLERLFKLTLDCAWLAEIYPYLVAYLDWWLAERTDADGWAVYKCTWEAGEDDTPRLDPERRGDNVVSAYVRPVELQATMALSAGVLARFATVLGRGPDATRWRQVEAAFLDRTRHLWDAAEGRFRDWDARNGRFLAPAGQDNYWGIDPCRYSALAFTPLLAGLSDDAMRDGLRAELQSYAQPPWTLWASWSYVVLEAAPLTGDTPFAGRVAAEIVDRVYGELDVRQIAGPSHPTPGVAREFWPLDLDTWASCEGYGWGANTASLLVRQVFGFLEGPYLDVVTPLTFELRPALPAGFLVPGREYMLTNLPYRGARLTIAYRVEAGADADTDPGDALTILVSADVPTRCRAVDLRTGLDLPSAGVEDGHRFQGSNGGQFRIELRPLR